MNYEVSKSFRVRKPRMMNKGGWLNKGTFLGVRASERSCSLFPGGSEREREGGGRGREGGREGD